MQCSVMDEASKSKTNGKNEKLAPDFGWEVGDGGGGEANHMYIYILKEPSNCAAGYTYKTVTPKERLYFILYIDKHVSKKLLVYGGKPGTSSASCYALLPAE